MDTISTKNVALPIQEELKKKSLNKEQIMVLPLMEMEIVLS